MPTAPPDHTAPPRPPGRDAALRVLFGAGEDRRFTQDTPVLPEVWVGYATRPLAAQDLLMTPRREATAGAVAAEIRGRLHAFREGEARERERRDRPARARGRARLVHLPGTVVARLELDETMRLVLPSTSWWRRRVAALAGLGDERLAGFPRPGAALTEALGEALHAHGLMGPVPPGDPSRARAAARAAEGWGEEPMPTDLLRLVRLVGAIALARRGSGRDRNAEDDGPRADEAFHADPLGALAGPSADTGPNVDPGSGGAGDPAADGLGDADDLDADDPDAGLDPARAEARAERDRERAERDRARARRLAWAFAGLYEDWPRYEPCERALIWRVNLNRPASGSVTRSVLAVKGDAARRLFEVSARGITWAVIDCGIDGAHPAFRDAEGRSRVVRTYDFSRLRDLLDPTSDRFAEEVREGEDTRCEQIRQLRARIGSAQDIDWAMLEPFVTRPDPEPPAHEHGTHVAGIIGAGWTGRAGGAPDLVGLCPDIRLIDARVLDPSTGRAREFEVIAALQFLRHLNARAGETVVHGANLSLSVPHDVENYACGRTPICAECEHAVANGIVVVAAAGNNGYRAEPGEGGRGIYRPSSITDPGNAEGVLTVGATHRTRPHQYGVSYFSGRGPTGDGRRKPDLVAPGEKIAGPLPGGRIGWRDGTSMAAPHVSGAAALLMARHGEFVGRPAAVKRILCESATDLGRCPHYQGAGMLDVLRALQSV